MARGQQTSARSRGAFATTPSPACALITYPPYPLLLLPLPQIDGEPVEPPHPLPWYPGKLAWQMNFSRNQVGVGLRN